MGDVRQHIEARVAMPTSWSADGSRLLVQSNLSGSMQLYEWSEAAGLVGLTDEKEPVNGRFLPVSDRVLVTRDDGGNERHQLFVRRADGSLGPLVVDPDAMHLPGGASRDGRFLAYATTRRNGTDFDVFVRDLSTGEERCCYDDGGWPTVGEFSPDGAWLPVALPTERSGDNDLVLLNLETGERRMVAPHDDDSSVSLPTWLADSSACLFVTDVGRDVPAIARYELADGSWDYVFEPGWECECLLDPTGRHLLVSRNEEGWTRAELRDPTTFALVAELALPGRGVASSWTFDDDGARLAFGFSSSSVPGDVWTVSLPDGVPVRVTESPCEVERTALVEPVLHRFSAFDGESIPLFLYRPAQAGPTPVVVYVHGGPESQARPSWNPLVGALVELGFTVAVPNVRGSAGYGKRYVHLDDRRRRLDSVADLAGLHAWLSARDDVDAARAALVGGSYGGYMVLAGLTFQPELWAAGVDVVGISSLVTFLENTSSYRRRFREREYGFLDSDRDFLIEASPLTHVDALRAPLFIIHGANDPRVALSEAAQLHETLTAKGVATELVVYDDEGHGLQKLSNRLDAYSRAVDFLERVLLAR
jgi:dipeptidyl aminopeptidase/acylaminoacyl peptidase